MCISLFFWIFPFLCFEWMCVGWEGESRRAWLICPKIEIWSQTFKTWKYREWRVTRGQDISKRKSRKRFNTDEKLFQGFYFFFKLAHHNKNNYDPIFTFFYFYNSMAVFLMKAKMPIRALSINTYTKSEEVYQSGFCEGYKIGIFILR